MTLGELLLFSGIILWAGFMIGLIGVPSSEVK